MNNEFSVEEDLSDDTHSSPYWVEHNSKFEIFFNTSVNNNPDCFYSVLKGLNKVLDEGNTLAISNPIFFLNEFIKSILKSFEVEFHNLCNDFNRFESEVKERLQNPIIYKNDLVFKDIEIDENFIKNFLPEICNYKLCKIILSELPPVFERVISFIILDILPNPENFNIKENKYYNFWEVELEKQLGERKNNFKQFNQSIENLFGSHLDQIIQFTQKKYNNKTLIDYEPLLRTLFLQPIFHKLKFKIEPVPFTHRYLILYEILAITHPFYRFTSEVDWERKNGDEAANSPKFKQKRLEEVNRFFKVKQLHRLK